MKDRTSRFGRRRYWLLPALLIAALVLMIPSAFATHDYGLFELEGNAVEDVAADPMPWNTATGLGPHDDWANIYNGTDSAAAKLFIHDAVNSTSDDIFGCGDGSKDDQEIERPPGAGATTAWCWVEQKPQGKNDISDAFAAAYFVPDGDDTGTDPDLVLYFGLDRYAKEGSAQTGFWITQNPVSKVGTTSGTFSGAHTPNGDVLVQADYTQGGALSTVKAFLWKGDGTGDSGDGDIDQIATGATCGSAVGDPLCAINNTEATLGADADGSIVSPWPFSGKDASKIGDNLIQFNSFFEGGINISDVIDGFDICLGGFIAETRSSGSSIVSTLSDFAGGNFKTCPDVRISKTPDSGSYYVNDSFNWVLDVNNDGAAASNVVVTDTIPVGLTVNTATFDRDPGTAGDNANACVIGAPGVGGTPVTCNIGSLAGSDGNTTGAEPDAARVTINVTATAAAVGGTGAACAVVNNQGDVTATLDTDTSNNSDSGQVTVCRADVSKTADAFFKRTYKWKITKSVDPTSQDLFQGDATQVTWSVTTEADGYTDSGWKISGNITVSAPTGAPTRNVTSVTDVFDPTGAIDPNVNATVDCNGATAGDGLPASLAGGSSLACTYSADLTGPLTGTNTATASIANVPSGSTPYSGTASLAASDWATPDAEDDEQASVSDTNGQSFGPYTWSTSFSATETYNSPTTCSATLTYVDGKATYTLDNTATVTANDTGANSSSSASTTVNCYQLAVSKDIDAYFKRTYKWKITKTVDPTSQSLFQGDATSVSWSVTTEADGYTDSGWKISGSVTVVSPAGAPTRSVNVTDVFDPDAAGEADVSVALDCNGATAGDGLPADLAGGSSLSCTYDETLSGPLTGKNTATASVANVPSGTTSFSGDATLAAAAWTTPDAEDDENANVADTNGHTFPGLPYTWSSSFSQTETYTSPTTCSASLNYVDGKATYTLDNTATVTATDTGANSSDDASTTVDCYQLAVSKDIDAYFKRTWTWTVDKGLTTTPPATLAVGATLDIGYSVEYEANFTDSDHAVSGGITVSSPTGAPTRTVDVTDVFDPDEALVPNVTASVDCNGATAGTGLPASLAGGASLSCTYETGLTGAFSGKNTATASVANVPSGTTSFTGDATLAAAAWNTPDLEADETINVTDNNPGTVVSGAKPSGSLTASPPEPWTHTFNYTIRVGPYTVAQCGDKSVNNTAYFTTTDNGVTGEDSVTVRFNVPCPQAKLTPTAVDCTIFAGGTAPDLTELNYQARQGTISNISPGVFFYWMKLTGTTNGTNVFALTQTIGPGGDQAGYFGLAEGSFVWSSTCSKVDSGTTVTQSGNTTTISFPGTAGATYYIGIKFSAASVVGRSEPSPTPATYTFEVTGVADSSDSLVLKKK